MGNFKIIKKMNYNKKLIETCINVAGLARRMNISPALFGFRFNNEHNKRRYADIVQLVKALDVLTFELVEIRENLTKEALKVKDKLIKELDE